MRYSTSELNYTNQWFKMVWFWYLLRIMGAVGIAGFVAVGLMITAWAPEWTPLYIRAVFAAIGIAFLLCIVWFFVAVFRVFFAKPYQPRQPDEWTPNPPAGESWFRADGTKKQYNRVTGQWS